jgi:hypothetical protein
MLTSSYHGGALETKRKRRLKRVLGFPVLLLLVFMISSRLEAAEGLKRVGRWLTYNGKNVYLVGMDAQELACDPSLDYERILDQFVQYRINKVRIWIYCYFGTDAGFLHPWKQEANGRYNLDAWNPAYWQRIRDFVAKARDREIVVEVSIFPPNFLRKSGQWSNEDWRPAWNKDFNVNGVFGANSEGHFVPEFFDLDYHEVSNSGKRLIDYQKALVDKTIAELGSFENVYFEIANEFPVGADIDQVFPWQQHWARYIRESSSEHAIACHGHAFSGSHTKGIEYWWDEPYIDILNFHFYDYNPRNISDLLHAAHVKGKVVSLNESGFFYNRKKLWFYTTDWFLDRDRLNENTRLAYGMFLSGGYFTLYCADNSKLGDKDWQAGANRMKVLRDVAESVRFWEMSPVDASGSEYDALVSQGPAGNNWQVLASPGNEYVLYFWGDESASDVVMGLPREATYRYQWYDCEDGDALGDGHVSGNDTARIAAPPVSRWNGDAGVVLTIQRKGHERLAKERTALSMGERISR